MKHKHFEGKGGKQTQSKNTKTSGVKKKWVPQNKHFEGSVREGQGFAFKRKQKAKHEYFKLMRKEKKKNPVKDLYKDEYPEHLKHLYLAEKEQLKNEAWTNRVNRTKHRLMHKTEGPSEGEETTQRLKHKTEGPSEGEETTQRLKHKTEGPSEDEETTQRQKHKTEGPSEDEEATRTDLKEPKNPSASVEVEPNPEIEQTEAAHEEEQTSLPMSNRMRKKMLKKTSHQKTHEEFERIQENRRKKQEEFLKNKQQREEARQRYKEKKMETFQMLCKKTKKGQPNLNLQMEYLLQKIQRTEKK